MPYRFLLIYLAVCASCIHTHTLFADSIEKKWLQCIPSDRFSLLKNLSPPSIDLYQEKLLPYLNARGISDSKRIDHFAREDFHHIAEALSILFEQDPRDLLRYFLGEEYFLVNEYHTHIDHVGRELFGPLSFYLPLSWKK